MSAYRRCHKGSWSESMQNIYSNLFYNILVIDFLNKYNTYSDRKYERISIGTIQKHTDAIVYAFKANEHNKFNQLCFRYIQEVNSNHENIIIQLNRLWLQIYDKSYIDEEIIFFKKLYQKVVIMGAGKYAKILAEQLEYNKIGFEGFTISDNQESEECYLGKPVWKLRELPFDKKSLGIIIGINPIKWNEILNILENAGIVNYMCPFLLRIK